MNGGPGSPPVAEDDFETTDQDTAFPGSVISNDSDPDGDTLTYAQVSDPSSGTVVFNANGT